MTLLTKHQVKEILSKYNLDCELPTKDQKVVVAFPSIYRELYNLNMITITKPGKLYLVDVR